MGGVGFGGVDGLMAGIGEAGGAGREVGEDQMPVEGESDKSDDRRQWLFFRRRREDERVHP